MNAETVTKLDGIVKDVERAMDAYLDELYKTIDHEYEDEFRENMETEADRATKAMKELRETVKELESDPSGIYCKVPVPDLQQCFFVYKATKAKVLSLVPEEHYKEAVEALTTCYDEVAKRLLPRLGKYGEGLDKAS